MVHRQAQESIVPALRLDRGAGLGCRRCEGDIHPLHIGQPHERPLSDRLMVKVPARSFLPMIAFRDALCITHSPVDGTVSQGREGPARFARCRITLRTPVGIIRKAALW